MIRMHHAALVAIDGLAKLAGRDNCASACPVIRFVVVSEIPAPREQSVKIGRGISAPAN